MSVSFSGFMGNESERGTNKSREGLNGLFNSIYVCYIVYFLHCIHYECVRQSCRNIAIFLSKRISWTIFIKSHTSIKVRKNGHSITYRQDLDV